MLPQDPNKGKIKFNLFSEEEIKRSNEAIEEVKKQIDKRTEQLKKLTITKNEKIANTVPGTLNIKDFDSEVKSDK
jgi:hypothetical protein